VEAAQGLSGHHTCRARDLIPDALGAAAAAAMLLAWSRLRSRPARDAGRSA
jgi:hypothetical protein